MKGAMEGTMHPIGAINLYCKIIFFAKGAMEGTMKVVIRG